jgi:hypothetical protein
MPDKLISDGFDSSIKRCEYFDVSKDIVWLEEPFFFVSSSVYALKYVTY